MASSPSFTPSTGLGIPARLNAVRIRSTHTDSSSTNNTLPVFAIVFDFSPPHLKGGQQLPAGSMPQHHGPTRSLLACPAQACFQPGPPALLTRFYSDATPQPR